MLGLPAWSAHGRTDPRGPRGCEPQPRLPYAVTAFPSSAFCPKRPGVWWPVVAGWPTLLWAQHRLDPRLSPRRESPPWLSNMSGSLSVSPLGRSLFWSLLRLPSGWTSSVPGTQPRPVNPDLRPAGSVPTSLLWDPHFRVFALPAFLPCSPGHTRSSFLRQAPEVQSLRTRRPLHRPCSALSLGPLCGRTCF